MDPFVTSSYLGRPADQVRAELEALGLVVTITSQFSDTVSSGHVIAQDPSAGSQIDDGGTVSLLESLGPAPVAVPETSGLTEAAAVTLLERAEFDVTVEPIVAGNLSRGRIVRSKPAGGQSVASGSGVTVYVSSGPSPSCSDLATGGVVTAYFALTLGLAEAQPDGSVDGFEPTMLLAVLDQLCGIETYEYRSLTAAERFEAVKNGEVDIMMTAASSRDFVGILLYSTPYVLRDDGQPQAFGIRSDPTLRADLDAALVEIIDSGKWHEIHIEWLGEPGYSVDTMLGTPLPEI